MVRNLELCIRSIDTIVFAYVALFIVIKPRHKFDGADESWHFKGIVGRPIGSWPGKLMENIVKFP